MKRLLCILSLVIVGAFGVNTATASAATCTASNDHIVWTGTLDFHASLTACSGVDYVQFDQLNTGYDGIWDASVGYFHTAVACNGCGTQWYIGANATTMRTGKTITYSTYAWCGGAVHTVSTYYYYRIHNNAGVGTWGSWHVYGGSWFYPINC